MPALHKNELVRAVTQRLEVLSRATRIPIEELPSPLRIAQELLSEDFEERVHTFTGYEALPPVNLSERAEEIPEEWKQVSCIMSKKSESPDHSAVLFCDEGTNAELYCLTLLIRRDLIEYVERAKQEQRQDPDWEIPDCGDWRRPRSEE